MLTKPHTITASTICGYQLFMMFYNIEYYQLSIHFTVFTKFKCRHEIKINFVLVARCILTSPHPMDVMQLFTKMQQTRIYCTTHSSMVMCKLKVNIFYINMIIIKITKKNWISTNMKSSLQNKDWLLF